MKWPILILSILFTSACVAPYDSPDAYLPEAAELNRQLGIAYLQQNDLITAQNRLMLAQQQDPQSARILNSLAYLFQKTQQATLAKSYYERAMALQPNNPEVLRHFGAFLCQQGDYAHGIALLQRAKKYSDFSILPGIDDNLAICRGLMGQ